MRRYLVKTTSVATKENPYFAGEVQVYYTGKEETDVKREGTHEPELNFDRIWLAEEYGYKRECDARRNWEWKHRDEASSKHWTVAVEIVEVEIEG